jgi:hypothetical protein
MYSTVVLLSNINNSNKTRGQKRKRNVYFDDRCESMSFSPLAIPPDTLTLLHGCMLEREAAFWLVSEMFIFISVKMPKNRGRSFRGSI